MARRKSLKLPRVLVYAMDRRALLAFVEAVEKVAHLVGDLQNEVKDLRTEVSRVIREYPPRVRKVKKEPIGVATPGPQPGDGEVPF
jgi:phage host-nuclease inhibitor protein Gam